MAITTDNRYKIETVENYQFSGLRKGKWKELLYQLKTQLKALPNGKSVKITFDSNKEVNSFAGSARSSLLKWGFKNYFVGKALPENAVYIGKK